MFYSYSRAESIDLTCMYILTTSTILDNRVWSQSWVEEHNWPSLSAKMRCHLRITIAISLSHLTYPMGRAAPTIHNNCKFMQVQTLAQASQHITRYLNLDEPPSAVHFIIASVDQLDIFITKRLPNYPFSIQMLKATRKTPL